MNTLVVLSLSCALATALAFLLPRWDTALAWILALAVTLSAGLRTDGFDHNDYVGIIVNVRALADASLPLRLVAAKDPLFLALIEGVGRLSHDSRWVFLLIAAIGMATKVVATAIVPRRRTLLIALYIAFLSPGLEFAAIRAGMALGFAMLAVSLTWRWRHIWTVIAVASHLSLLVPAVGLLIQRYRRRTVFCMLLIAPLVLPWMIAIGEDEARYSQYFSNPGRLTAYLLPVMTLIAWWPIQSIARRHGKNNPWLRSDALASTWSSLIVATLLAQPAVTVSLRLLEISWVLITAQVVATMQLRLPASARLDRNISLSLMLATLVAANLLRGTWAALAVLQY